MDENAISWASKAVWWRSRDFKTFYHKRLPLIDAYGLLNRRHGIYFSFLFFSFLCNSFTSGRSTLSLHLSSLDPKPWGIFAYWEGGICCLFNTLYGRWTLVGPSASALAQGRCAIAHCPTVWGLIVVSLLMKGWGDNRWWHEEDWERFSPFFIYPYTWLSHAFGYDIMLWLLFAIKICSGFLTSKVCYTWIGPVNFSRSIADVSKLVTFSWMSTSAITLNDFGWPIGLGRYKYISRYCCTIQV